MFGTALAALVTLHFAAERSSPHPWVFLKKRKKAEKQSATLALKTDQADELKRSRQKQYVSCEVTAQRKRASANGAPFERKFGAKSIALTGCVSRSRAPALLTRRLSGGSEYGELVRNLRGDVD